MAKKRKKKKASQRLLRIITLVALLAFLTYKYNASQPDVSAQLPKAANTLTLTSSNDRLEIPIMHVERGGQLLKRTGYTLSYDADRKTPQWVAWELTREETLGSGKRSEKFYADPDVRGAKAYHKDYSKSGYDRGHMAPAGDMKWNEQAMDESFYLSNICPQNGNLNKGDWNDLEELCRKWAQRYGSIYIACGPIYEAKHPKRIGANKVAVPDAFFKVILIYTDDRTQAFGFLFPNRAGHQPLHKYLVSVDSLENRTGMDFFPALPDAVEEKLESAWHDRLP